MSESQAIVTAAVIVLAFIVGVGATLAATWPLLTRAYGADGCACEAKRRADRTAAYWFERCSPPRPLRYGDKLPDAESGA